MGSRSLIRNLDDLIEARTGKLSILRKEVLEAAEAGVKNVMPENFMKKVRLEDNFLLIGDSFKIDLRGYDEVVVLGAGKAVVQMAEYIERLLEDRISRGLIVSSTDPCKSHNLRRIDLFPSTHPIPSKLGLEASEEMMEYADCLLYTSPSPRDLSTSRMPSSA